MKLTVSKILAGSLLTCMISRKDPRRLYFRSQVFERSLQVVLLGQQCFKSAQQIAFRRKRGRCNHHQRARFARALNPKRLRTFGKGQQPMVPFLDILQHVKLSGHCVLLSAHLTRRGRVSVGVFAWLTHFPCLISHVVPAGQQVSRSEQHTAFMEKGVAFMSIYNDHTIHF